MRRPKWIPEDPPPADIEREKLISEINILMPIRSHRLRKSERDWRKEKQTLAAIHRQIEEKTAALIEEKRAYQAERETLSHAYQSQCIDHQTLKGWLGQEKALYQSLETSQCALHDLQRSLEQQEAHVAQAKTRVDACHVEQERLHILVQEIEES